MEPWTATACRSPYRMPRLSIKEAGWLALAGTILSVVAVWLLGAFVHSSPFLSGIGLVLVLPFMAVSRWGRELPDWAFWGTFMLAQAVYVVVIYLLIRSIFSKGSRST